MPSVGQQRASTMKQSCSSALSPGTRDNSSGLCSAQLQEANVELEWKVIRMGTSNEQKQSFDNNEPQKGIDCLVLLRSQAWGVCNRDKKSVTGQLLSILSWGPFEHKNSTIPFRYFPGHCICVTAQTHSHVLVENTQINKQQGTWN